MTKRIVKTEDLTIIDVAHLESIASEEIRKGRKAYYSAITKSGRRKSLTEAYKRFTNFNALNKAIKDERCDQQIDVRVKL